MQGAHRLLLLLLGLLSPHICCSIGWERDNEGAGNSTRRMLITGHKRPSLGSRTCMAEEMCIQKFCGKGYDHTANKFPYTITYDKHTTDSETTFEFDVCIKACSEDERYCEPLLSWSIRLDTELVLHKDFIKEAVPVGSLLEQCDETGLGYRWEAGQLQGLQDHEPWKGDRCEKFKLTIKHDPHMAGNFWLTDICQQRIDIVATKNGKTMFSQTTSSSIIVAKDKFSDVGSCLIHFRTRGGVFGFTLLEDWEYETRDRRPIENQPDLSSGLEDMLDNTARRRALLEFEKREL